MNPSFFFTFFFGRKIITGLLRSLLTSASLIGSTWKWTWKPDGCTMASVQDWRCLAGEANVECVQPTLCYIKFCWTMIHLEDNGEELHYTPKSGCASCSLNVCQKFMLDNSMTSLVTKGVYILDAVNMRPSHHFQLLSGCVGGVFCRQIFDSWPNGYIPMANLGIYCNYPPWN